MSGGDLVCPCCGTLVPGASLQQRVAAAREVVSPTVAVILDVLARRPGAWVRTEALVHAICGHRADGGPDWPESVIKVSIFRQRPRLADFGLRVTGRSGRDNGAYRLEVAA